MQTAELKFLRNILGKQEETIINKRIRGHMGEAKIAEQSWSEKLKWFGHLSRGCRIN